MAFTTESNYTGNGSNKDFIITFPFLADGDVKVRTRPSGGSWTTHTVTTHYTIAGTTLTFVTAPVNNADVQIFRDTDIDQTKVTFQTGASIRAQDLNNISKQFLYAAQEFEQASTTPSGTGLALTSGTKNHITVNSVNDWTITAGSLSGTQLAINSIDSDKYVDGSIDNEHLANLSVSTGKIQDDAVTADKLANSINTEIAANTAKVTNATHTGEVTGATALTIADNIVDEANLKVDNTPTNDQVLTAKSSAAGGLTWAAVAVSPLRGFKTVKYTGSQQTIPQNTWTDVTDLTITYTPTLSSSIIVLEAHLNLYSRAQDQSSYVSWSDSEQQFIVTPTGGSAATVGEFQAITTGAGTQSSALVNYATAHRTKWNFYEEYTNSNTTEKTFKVQLKRNDVGELKIHDQEGHSYFTLKEYTP